MTHLIKQLLVNTYAVIIEGKSKEKYSLTIKLGGVERNGAWFGKRKLRHKFALFQFR